MRHTATHPQHSEEEGDKEEEGSMAHTAPGCHQEKLFLGHLTHRSVRHQHQHQQHDILIVMTVQLVGTDTGVLTCCGSVAASL